MGERQMRYRDRRIAEGWQRIELLVPATAVPWVKAYAHALRSADTLGLPPPAFDGMGVAADTRPMLNPPKVAARLTPENEAKGSHPSAVGQSATGSDATDALFDRIKYRQRQENDELARRPDFSKGLLRE